MATADLKLIYGGGSFKPTFFSGSLSVASGATGTILSITAPAGKKVRLTALLVDTGTEANIQVSTDTGIVIGPLVLQPTSDGAADGRFVVGPNSAATRPTAGIDYIESTSSIIVEKTSGATANTIRYAYAYGD